MQTTIKKSISRDINLLKHQATLTLEELQLKKTIFILTIVGSLILVLISLIVLIVSINISNSAKDAKELEKKWTDKILTMPEAEISLFTISQKLKAAKVIKDSINYHKIFSTLNEVIQEKVTIVNITINSSGQLFIDGESLDSISLLAFFDGLISKDKDGLKYVMLNNLTLTKDKIYRFSIGAKYFVNR